MKLNRTTMVCTCILCVTTAFTTLISSKSVAAPVSGDMVSKSKGGPPPSYDPPQSGWDEATLRFTIQEGQSPVGVTLRRSSGALAELSVSVGQLTHSINASDLSFIDFLDLDEASVTVDISDGKPDVIIFLPYFADYSAKDRIMELAIIRVLDMDRHEIERAILPPQVQVP